MRKRSCNVMKKLLITLLIFMLTLSFSATAYAGGNIENKDSSIATSTCGGDKGKLELTKSAINEGDGTYRLKFDVNGDKVTEEGEKADIVLMIDVSDSMREIVPSSDPNAKPKTRLDLVKEAVNKFCDLIRSKKSDVDLTDDVRIAVGEFSIGVPKWVKLRFSEKKWRDLVISKVPDDTWQYNEANGYYYLYETKSSYQGEITSSIGYRKDRDGIEYWRYKEDIRDKDEDEEFLKRDNKGDVWYWDKRANSKDDGDEGDASEVCGFTNVTNAEMAVNTLTTCEDTDTRAGINLVGNMLDKARPEVKNHVLFFTDGLCNISEAVNPFDYEDETAYINAVIDDAINQYNIMMNGRENTDFYSVGLMQGLDKEKKEDELALRLLKGIQNAGYRMLEDSAKLNQTFVEIAEAIMDKSYTTIATDVVLTDIIAEDFILPEDIELEVDDKYRDKIKYNRLSDRKVEFLISKIDTNGFSFSFVIHKSDPYYSSKDVKTNDGATISYKDYNKEDQNGTFGDPKVTLTPLKGKIEVSKQLTDDSYPKTENDSFSVLLEGVDTEEKHNIEIAPDEKKTMEFYMKDKKTDISTSLADKAFGYITVGHFDLYEFLPAYYKLIGLEISYDGKDYKEYKDYSKKDPTSGVTIDKDHPNIYIRLTNKKVSESHWWDKKTKDNNITVVNK